MRSVDRGESAREELLVRMGCAADADAFVRFNRAMALETEGKKLDEAIVEPGVRAMFEDPARGFYVVAESANDIVAH